MPSDPARGPVPLPPDRAHVDFVAERLPLFAGKRLGAQVQQGGLGDCFVLASLASLAQRRPDDVRAAIREAGSDRYAVRLFRHDGPGWVPQEVDVDGKIAEAPISKGEEKPVYATTMGRFRALWVSLFEKAYADVHGGYIGMNRGGPPMRAIGVLTGHDADHTWLEHAVADAIWGSLERGIAERRITLATTWSDDEARAMLKRKHEAGEPSLPAHVREVFAHVHHGLVGGHVYSVWGLSGAGDARVIHLRNPWGEDEPRGNGPDDGLFAFPFTRFMLLFADVLVEV